MAEEKTEKCPAETTGNTCPVAAVLQVKQEKKKQEGKSWLTWKRGVLIGLATFLGLFILLILLNAVAPKQYVILNGTSSIKGSADIGAAVYQQVQSLPEPSARLTSDLAKVEGNEQSLSTTEYWATQTNNAKYASTAEKAENNQKWTKAQNTWQVDAQQYNAELTAEGFDKLPLAALQQLGLRPPIDITQIPRWYTDTGQPLS